MFLWDTCRRPCFQRSSRIPGICAPHSMAEARAPSANHGTQIYTANAKELPWKVPPSPAGCGSMRVAVHVAQPVWLLRIDWCLCVAASTAANGHAGGRQQPIATRHPLLWAHAASAASNYGSTLSPLRSVVCYGVAEVCEGAPVAMGGWVHRMGHEPPQRHCTDFTDL